MDIFIGYSRIDKKAMFKTRNEIPINAIRLFIVITGIGSKEEHLGYKFYKK